MAGVVGSGSSGAAGTRTAGKTAQVAGFAWNPIDISDFPTRHPYGLALWQSRIEHLLAEWVAELGVGIRRGGQVTGLTQDAGGASIALADGGSLRARYLVGCDGGRSLSRKAVGIDFAGFDPSISCLLAEVEVAADPPWGLQRDSKGIRAFSRAENGRSVRIMVSEPDVERGRADPTMLDLRQALIAGCGADFGVHSPTWLSRFTDMTRQATEYRKGRVLIAGDAAHVHSPAGGQGLNLGLQDAVNLGWKLAQVVKGTSPESLLDSYQAEQHPVAARVLRNTMAQTALLRGDDRTDALRDTVAEVLRMDEPRKRIAGMISGLDIHYDLGGGHPLLGRRMPDLDLATASGPVRVSTLLHKARPVLLTLGEPMGFDCTPWADRLRMTTGTYDGGWDLPVLGRVPAPTAVLIRPDGYVAWVGEGTHQGLPEALLRWLGPPRA